jgi:iron complex transport system permease protein
LEKKMLYPQKKSWGFIILGLFLFCLVVMLFSITIGPANITFKETLLLALDKLPFTNLGPLVEDYPASHHTIIFEVRMPRVILASLTGAALTAAGATMQGLFKNPMADPYILGVSAGASLGAAIAIVSSSSQFLGLWTLPVNAFLGALLSTVLVYSLARIGNKVPVYTLLLAGIALSSLLNAIMSFIMIKHSEELKQIVYWTLGTFSGAGWNEIWAALPFVLIGLSLIIFFAKDLNAMLLGEESAHHLGLNVEQTKKLLLAFSALIVAAVVSVTGTIGFVGLIIPHMIRLIVGPDHRILLPASILFGATFMVFTDTLARTILAPGEIPVGIITAFFGGPFFIYLLKKRNIDLF